MFIELLLSTRCYVSGGGDEEMPPTRANIKVAFQCHKIIYVVRSLRRNQAVVFLN